MTSEALVEPAAQLPRGEARFIRTSEIKSLVTCCEQDGYVRVDIPELRPGIRGRLAWLLEEAIERCLEIRGAASTARASDDPEVSLAEQLYRARLIGARGLVMVLPTLDAITSRIGALDADDSATLRWWMASTRSHPIRLYLDVSDCMLGAYLEPVTLTQLMHTAIPTDAAAAPPVVVEWIDGAAASRGTASAGDIDTDDRGTCVEAPISDVVASARCASASIPSTPTQTADSDDLDDPPPTETTLAPLVLEPSIAPPPRVEPSLVPPPLSTRVELSLVPPPPDANGESLSIPPSAVAAEPLLVSPALGSPIDCREVVLPEAPTPDPSDTSLTPIAAETSLELVLASRPTGAPPPCHEGSVPPQRGHDAILPIPHPATIPAPQPVIAEEQLPPEPEPLRGPLHTDAPIAWQSWMHRLEAARGPKPLNTIEQLFIQAYVPLSDAYHRGIAGAEAKQVLDRWSASFAKSYADAFDALRLRGHRPMMVLDIPESAQRLSRLHGARSVQLVLVDGMRFDLGLRVEACMLARLGQQATLTDRFLLWSALPTTTGQQLELIARGPDGLRVGEFEQDTPVLVARGRSASTLRRVRAGSRELLKLDLVEARLGEAGCSLADRLDQLASEVSDALVSALVRMPPRTLVTVFGDHGFCLDSTDAGTSALRQGGASPEEVLVPGFAWLVGPTH